MHREELERLAEREMAVRPYDGEPPSPGRDKEYAATEAESPIVPPTLGELQGFQRTAGGRGAAAVGRGRGFAARGRGGIPPVAQSRP